jgi:hypothetical protein
VITAYPLQWPEGWPKTAHRKEARFSTKGCSKSARALTIADGVDRVLRELERMGYGRNDIVISTNVPTRLDGLPRSDRGEPSHPAVAVYWRTKKGENKVMAIDIYDRVADNLAAIAATLDAMRSIERHGGAQILERAFTGFTALSAPTGQRSWREVMTFGESSPTPDQLKQRYRELAGIRHPDKGGSHAAMSELNVAYAQGQEEIGK